eukprot:scaffold8005_cov118-Isochrysis_galbana.AAC.23
MSRLRAGQRGSRGLEDWKKVQGFVMRDTDTAPFAIRTSFVSLSASVCHCRLVDGADGVGAGLEKE